MMLGTKRRLGLRDFSLEVKAADVADDGTFTGYGSVFGVEDSYGEIVAPGAFAESLAEIEAKGRKLPVLWQHDQAAPLGIYNEVEEDETGLRVQGKLLIGEVGQAREAHALLKAGAVTGLSIGYWVRESSFDEKTKIRTLLKLDLVEVSLVTFPANDDARVDGVKFKLAHGELPTIREFERFLREAGMSKTRAAVIANHGLSHLLRSESEGATASDIGGLKALSDQLRGFSLPPL